MITILLSVQVILAVTLVCIVLLQSSSSDTLSGLSGGSNMMGKPVNRRSAANLLTKTTTIIAALFMLNSLALGRIVNEESSSKRSVFEEKLPIEEKVQQKEEIAAPIAK
jgi:preprotein translocase subunit SecG